MVSRDHAAQKDPAMVGESLTLSPLARAAGAGVAEKILGNAIQSVSTADPKDVQKVAASQLELLTAYHQVALAQSRRSFFWALIGSGVGLALFAVAVRRSLDGPTAASVVPLIAGAVVQVISGVVFYLYGQTSSQLSAFHGRLEVLQRYLLANSICESLGEAEREARAALVGEISRAPRTDAPSVTATIQPQTAPRP
jgi:hypothetical protein